VSSWASTADAPDAPTSIFKGRPLRSRFVRGRALVGVPIVLFAALLAAACGGAKGGSGQSTADRRVPLPAGPYPSAVSKMVCSAKTQGELANVLVVTAQVPTPSWVDHVYTCRFTYSDGVMVLSVKELSSWSDTIGYFRALSQNLGNIGPLTGLGQGAFTTGNGSVVARKDYKVLLIDISGLPAQFGVPATSSGDVADTVADVVMGCWAGD
jgi:hypothetical protein